MLAKDFCENTRRRCYHGCITLIKWIKKWRMDDFLSKFQKMYIIQSEVKYDYNIREEDWYVTVFHIEDSSTSKL